MNVDKVLDEVVHKVNESQLFEEVRISYEFMQVVFTSKAGYNKYQFRGMVDGSDESFRWEIFYGKKVGDKWAWSSKDRTPRIPKDEKLFLSDLMHYVLFEI